MTSGRRAAGWHRWKLGIMFGTVMAVDNGKTVARDCREYDAEHIAEFDPARVLAEVDAKRRIIDQYEQLRADVAHWRGLGDEDAAPVATEWAYGEVVKMLALPYADRPGYLEEWRP